MLRLHTSATTRLRPTPIGQVHVCPPRRNGSAPPALVCLNRLRRWLGSGRRWQMARIQAFERLIMRRANTTASAWWRKWSCWAGASVTPAHHSRLTYRNFYRAEQRWMFSGVRLARDPNPSGESSELTAAESDFAVDVIAGLSVKEKTLPPKYFYDAAGSELFEAISRTPEYYPTRVETALLQQSALEIAARIPEGAVLVEFGSGASDNTRVIPD